MKDNWIKIKFPKTGNSASEIGYNYRVINNWFDNNGYRYNQDYIYQWDDTGKFVPDEIWCNSDLALLFKLKYNIN